MGAAWPEDDDLDAWRARIESFHQSTEFQKFELIDVPPETGATVTVTWRATLVQDGADASFTECSTFRQGSDGRWRYSSVERLS